MAARGSSSVTPRWGSFRTNTEKAWERAGRTSTLDSAPGPKPGVRAERHGSGEDPMCPACVATAALMVSGVISTGGLTALAVSLFGSKKDSKRDGLKKERNAKEK